MVLVDSSIWIDALRRDGDLNSKLGLEGLLEVYEAQFCPPVRLEVLGGARPQDRRQLEEYFSCIPCAPAVEADWQEAVKHAWAMSARGVHVPWNDLLIAAVALRLGIRVFTRDKHFDAMATHLGLRLYRPGYGGTFTAEDE